ncbi:MAG: baseplate J/gp47 family protein [bacterium]
MPTSIYTDFSKRDFTSSFERLLSILSKEVPELTDRNHSDAGISLIRLLCYQTDMLSFYIDEVFSEGYISTARFRQSVIDLATLVDVRPKLSSPASCTMEVSKKPGFENLEIIIEPNSQFTRQDGVSYINLDRVVIPAGSVSASFDVFQMTQHKLDVTKSDFEQVANFKKPMLYLGKNVVSEFVELYDKDSDWYWNEVDSFYRSLPYSTDFMLVLYADDYKGQNDSVFLVIGDGRYGTDIFPDNATVTFYTTEGEVGNCGTGVIDDPPSNLRHYVECSNTTVASGGALAEDTDSFRSRLPLVVRTQRRGITESDYEALIRSIPGVLYCQAVSRSSDSSWPYMYIFIYVLPEGGGKMSPYLSNVVTNKCMEWGHFGDWAGRYVIMDANEVKVNVKARIGVSNGFRTSKVVTEVHKAIQNFFLPKNVLIGRGISFASLHKAVSLVPGVEWVEFDSPSGSIAPSAGDTYVLGSVSIDHGKK